MGTWPGSPPDMCNIRPGDFDPEPNWRSLVEQLRAENKMLKARIKELEHKSSE